MNTKEILAHYDQDERQNAAVPGMRTEVDGPVVRLMTESEEEGMDFVIYSALDEENADREIARQVDTFSQSGRAFEWKTFEHDRPGNLMERLSTFGFEAGEAEALCVLELAEAPPRLLAPQTADVRRLTDPADLETVRRLLAAVWDDEFAWFVPRMESYMEGDYAAIYTAYVAGEPASAAWSFFPPGSRFASLYGGSTLPRYRGRGLYTALVAARVQEAIRRGYQFLTIDAGDMSQPIVERQGFRLMTNTTPYIMKNA